ncbi:hypothetical protein N7533_000185 [Penicillium manginii]|jgi:hypothetical protein|uniref:uncharacterized protein n=1 Tax=Penicillium manginii TaxID=203109 RepID=UPI002547D688|nr:uncharacterized protein N7533_000185 [Penicillium manginii]KAJ5767602.1 hypothetical protein N7533_000185 [Penicillium manginii]
MACIQSELDLKRLHEISPWLWIAGRPVPPRPLHHQLVLSRDIFITERMDMHLVWTIGRIFIKPIPRFLLSPDIWVEYLSCPARGTRVQLEPNSLAQYYTSQDDIAPRAHHERLWGSALGFLYSYAALISHESDFLIAKDKKLIPPEVTWSDWMTLVQEILATNNLHQKIDDRFNYGELRLSRLNKIYNIRQASILRGYVSHWQWTRYGDFFQENLAWLTAVTVYIAVVLAAMQVGLATDALVVNRTFQLASYGFTVFSILGPLIGLSIIGVVFCYMFLNNWISAVVFKRKRLDAIHSGQGA